MVYFFFVITSALLSKWSIFFSKRMRIFLNRLCNVHTNHFVCLSKITNTVYWKQTMFNSFLKCYFSKQGLIPIRNSWKLAMQCHWDEQATAHLIFINTVKWCRMVNTSAWHLAYWPWVVFLGNKNSIHKQSHIICNTHINTTHKSLAVTPISSMFKLVK